MNDDPRPTVDEAVALGVSRSSLLKAIAKNAFAVTRDGGMPRVRSSDLPSWVEFQEARFAYVPGLNKEREPKVERPLDDDDVQGWIERDGPIMWRADHLVSPPASRSRQIRPP